MIVDTHIHTEFSSDSQMKIEDVIEKAKKENLGIILTEHYDLDYPGEDFKCDVEGYFKAYEKYRSKELLLGIEIGMAPSTLDANEKIVKSYPFDYVLASIHGVNEVDIFKEYIYQGIEERVFYEEYYNYMLKCVQMYEEFDSLAHIDYIHRYAQFKDVEIRVNDYREQIAMVMKTLIQKEKAMEINTRRMESVTSREALLEVYKLFRDLGGKYITIGSDSHSRDAIGAYFKEALEMSENLGLKPVYFNKRKMEYCKTY